MRFAKSNTWLIGEHLRKVYRCLPPPSPRKCWNIDFCVWSLLNKPQKEPRSEVAPECPSRGCPQPHYWPHFSHQGRQTQKLKNIAHSICPVHTLNQNTVLGPKCVSSEALSVGNPYLEPVASNLFPENRSAPTVVIPQDEWF